MKSKSLTTKAGGNLPPPFDPDLAAWCSALASPAVTDVIPPGWFTTKQLADKLNRTRPTMARLLADAVAAGRCEVQKFRVSVGSFSRATPHYKPR
jgi:hypothetical protein